MGVSRSPASRPAAHGAPCAVRPLRIGRPTACSFARRRPTPLGRLEKQIFTDLLASLGEEPDFDLRARGGGHSFIDMFTALLDKLDRPLRPIDELVLAHVVPDMSLVEVAGCYLSHRCPGTPEVFSVAGQGVGAGFTALRIGQALVASTHRSSAALVIDQTTLPYRDADVHTGSHLDCAVLLSEPQDEDALELESLDEHVIAEPSARIRAQAGSDREALILAGSTLVRRLDPKLVGELGPRLVRGSSAYLCTSAWAALAEHWQPSRRVFVADFDPHNSRLFEAWLRPAHWPESADSAERRP